MFAIARVLVIGALALSVVYICLLQYFRAGKRDRLEHELDRHASKDERAQVIEARMRDYTRLLSRRLILGVYILPLTLISVVIGITNT